MSETKAHFKTLTICSFYSSEYWIEYRWSRTDDDHDNCMGEMNTILTLQFAFDIRIVWFGILFDGIKIKSVQFVWFRLDINRCWNS